MEHYKPDHCYTPKPFITNLEQTAYQNINYRKVVWTGDYEQLTVMSIPVHSDIGLEIHPDTDQIIRIEHGFGMVQMGTCKNQLNIQQRVGRGAVIFVPAGTWHNVTNIGNSNLKISTIYAPPHHKVDTIQRTKCDAMNEEN